MMQSTDKGELVMSCETCEVLKDGFAAVLQAEVSAEHELHLAVIRGDGSSVQSGLRLDRAKVDSASRRLQLVEHQSIH